jgi:hypothetical protein
MIITTMVFATEQPPLDMEGHLNINSDVDVHALMTATTDGQDGVLLGTYLSPDWSAGEAIAAFEGAAEAFRAGPGGHDIGV